MQSPYQTGLAETMQAPQGQDAYDVYEKLFAMFAPEFSSPSEDWRKQAMANAIGMAGSAMLGGDTWVRLLLFPLSTKACTVRNRMSREG
jgi:hypothetical protein